MNERGQYGAAAELDTIGWVNTSEPLLLSQLRGKVVVIHAFQMLCPGCVIHGIPQASAIHELYPKDSVQVIGLHTVFEHHEVMTANALKVFVSEYRITFPVAIDRPSESGAIPNTMAQYEMKGTPTLVVLDKDGRVRLNHFGRMSDMQVGSIIGGLLEEKSDLLPSGEEAESASKASIEKCNGDGCSI